MMNSINSIESSVFNASRRVLVGVGVLVGLLLVGMGAAVVTAVGTDNAAAQRVEAATRIIRTKEWLEARNLDTNSSVDMMRALIMACDEMKARGERC